MILVDLERVSARRPDRTLFENLSVTVHSGDRLGVVGRNGSGKSTLLRMLSGAAQPEEGVVRRGRHVRVTFLPQDPQLPAGSVLSAVGPHWEAAAILEHLGMGGLAAADVATLSGGQAKRVALARALVDESDLLVLDEPTNHLDLDAIAWLEDRLARYRGGLVVVSHDRHLLDRVTTRILELDGRHHHLHDGGYVAYLAARSTRAEEEAAAEAVRRNLARAELAWLRRGAPARTRKPKARIAAATAVVEGGPRSPDRAVAPDLGSVTQGAAMPRLGERVVTLHGAGHRFSTGPWLFADLDLDLEPGGRLGVVGPNGSGKSTLLELLAGRVAPAAGRMETGPTVRLGYYDQAGTTLHPDQRVRDAVGGSTGPPSWEQVRLMERFGFDGDAQWAPVSTLSGGERRRLQLLLVLTGLPNVLLLDEPTNDLDLDTLRALEDHLESWPGSAVVVSHDRALLERTVEDVLVLDGTGRAAMAPGGYAGYEAARRAPTAGRAAPPVAGAAAATAAPGRAHTPVEPGRAPARPVAARRRSPSTLRRLLATAEHDLAGATADRDRLAAELSASDLDHVARARIASELAIAEATLVTVEERWMALAEELGA